MFTTLTLTIAGLAVVAYKFGPGLLRWRRYNALCRARRIKNNAITTLHYLTHPIHRIAQVKPGEGIMLEDIHGIHTIRTCIFGQASQNDALLRFGDRLTRNRDNDNDQTSDMGSR